MDSVIAKLDKMISLEVEQGYKNKAVIGGLQGVLPWWPQQARQACKPQQHGKTDGEVTSTGDSIQGIHDYPHYCECHGFDVPGAYNNGCQLNSLRTFPYHFAG